MKLKVNLSGRQPDQAQNQPQQEQEGFLPYVGRNIAKESTTGLYEKARSGGGLADVRQILQKAGRKAIGGQPYQPEAGSIHEALNKQGGILGKTSDIFVPTEQANQEAQQVLPKYLSEHKPEDYIPRLIGNIVTPGILGKGAAAAGLIKEAPSLIGSAITATGAHFGGQAVGAGAKAAGLAPEYADVAALGGSVLGGIAAHGVAPLIKGVHKQKAFNSSKNQMTKDIHKQKNSDIGELESFKKNYEDQIGSLEKSRTAKYAAAENAAKGIKADATKLKAELEKLQKNTESGIETAERTRIQSMIGQIDDLISNKQLSLDKAKNAKANLNATTWDRNLPSTLKNTNKKLVHSLNEFIAETGEKYPEHGIPFREAELETGQLKQLKAEQKEFQKDYATAKQSIEKKYSKEESDVRNLTYDQYTKTQKQNWKEALGEFAASETKGIWWQGPAIAVMTKVFGWPAAALSKLGFVVGKEAYNAGKSIYRIMKTHPEIAAEAKTAAANIAKRDFMAFTANIHRIHDEVEKVQEASPRRKGLRLR